ncbi:MAG: ShlB/FhaC/HecB family hemolysin secretion/activation protein [Achromobacter sp.]|uniref:Filamentous hemagglutinin transporter protein FhaC n=1 Tax=Achromobacter pulmonis TaxID=1389932 RepID=A0A6S7BXH6_9BURK|nr:ShlB/FhaC/HecB family hemolysin secretion/activation protein [Achromobacter pulmonis]MPT26515.1 ShlB/FhaC/HecB family hemolysin secretion/activation protein [Achromobacter sp.]CAB3823185.1 Filamentous hemagglutinin transporter protein FhaC [Achromobacter pulmonis]
MVGEVWQRAWISFSLLLFMVSASAQTQAGAAQELLRQQERERILRKQQEATPSVRAQPARAPSPDLLPRDETPCFPIGRIRLDGEDARRFVWALNAADPDNDAATGRCLGAEGISVVMTRVQNAVVARGFVTTRILAAPQDLTGGALTLTVVPGRIRAIRFAPGTSPRATASNAVPVGRGDLLNLRDIEQALENFKRVPTAEADIQIVPADGEDARPGESDLVIAWRQRSPPIRVSASLDDAGSKATGKLQGELTVSLDDLLMLNDLFYASLNHDVFNGNRKGTRGYTAHYSLPHGYWALSATASGYGYRQTVAGYSQNYVYSGTSDNAELRLSRLVHRDATRKTSLYGRGWMRRSNNFIDDTEIGVQRRRTGGWEVGLTHREYLGESTLDASLAYRRGTGAFNAMPAPEEDFGEGTSRMKVIAASAQLMVPLPLGPQRARYIGSWRAQWDRTPLVPQDRFSIGGRYSVRGFDGELSLMGERGWVWRNELGLLLGAGQELYFGADYGHVGGPSTRWLRGRNLAGSVIGLRGGAAGFHWDVFAGTPLSKPRGFQSESLTAGFTLGWSS